MNERKKQELEKQLELIEKRLADPEEYIAKDVNIEGTSWLHFGDWHGKSGHPLWMKNHMIHTTKKVRAIKEKALEKLEKRAKGKKA